MKGVHGKILIVDLTKRTFQVEEPPEQVYRKYLGGYGLGAWYLYSHIKPGCDPLGPDNILGFTPGLLNGTGAGFSGRYMVCGKSPLTGKGKRSTGEWCNGGWGNANSGGSFGPAIKRSGLDAIFFSGQADKPVYLLITDDRISIEDAGTLWGKDIVETEEALVAKHGEKAAVASIGVAGENMDLIAGICNDKGRIAARSGLGAVMGSKKLKALCLLANKKVEFFDRPRMLELNKAYFAQVAGYAGNKVAKTMIGMIDYFAPVMRVAKMGLAAPSNMLPYVMGGAYGGAQLGTTMSAIISSQNADSPVKNYKGVGYVDFPWKTAMKLRGAKYFAFAKKRFGCNSCPLRCGYILEYDKLPYQDKETHRPEYETICAFGSLILNSDLDLLLQANEYLNRSGMDTISAGVTVAYVLEGVEQGFFKKEDFRCGDYPGGFLPLWGDPTYIMPLLKLMVTREGIGDKLADGVWMAKSHFAGTEAFAIHANGSEMGMHDLRMTPNWGMSFLSDPTPGRHTTGNYDMLNMGMSDFFPDLRPWAVKAAHPYQQGKASAVAIKMHQVMESLGLCMFVYFLGKYNLRDLITSVTGWEMTAEEILEIGGRIQTTRQMFNAREGAIRHETPQRAIGSPPLTKGPIAGVSQDPEVRVQGYYEGMGFEQNGVPAAETLQSYGLDSMVPDLALCTGAPERLVNEYLVSDATAKKSKKPQAVQGG